VAELPSGTVTFLFTDVEGSTRLLHELGAEAYAAALAEHRRLLREAFVAQGGVEVDTQGDAFFVAFPTAPGALAAAAELTRALEAGPIRVRVGVHTGTPLVTAEGYVGADVHRAARIAAAGHGGQVLVSAATAALVGDGLVDLGEQRFKDLQAPERVFQLGEGVFPPLKSLYRSNLPVPATVFLGREQELAEVVALLGREDVRLLTLTGPGGTGKTRLALQAAAETADRYPDGVWWVPLAPLRDPALVVPELAQSLGVQESLGLSAADAVETELADRTALLVFDNLEHLLPGAATVVADLVARCPRVTVVVTSRERLQLQGEQVWPVPALQEDEGVVFFVTRARQLEPSFAPGAAAEELCRRLDGLPLALELAAARTTVLSTEQLLERLGGRLDLLRGSRDADPRQQTLRSTIAWSYDLLDPEERRLFRELSVFAGGCTLEAAEEVCGAGVDLLESLLAKSLVRRRGAPSGPRFWMLETIREFGAEELEAAGEARKMQARHADRFGALAERLAHDVRWADVAATAMVDEELPNFRAGLRFALDARDPVLSGRYLFGLWYHWITKGHGRESAAAAEEWLALDWSGRGRGTYAGLLAIGEILRYTGDPARAVDLKLELARVARADPDAVVGGGPIGQFLPAALTDLGHLLADLGRPAEAATVAEEALAIRLAEERPRGIAHAQHALVAIADAAGDHRRAYELAVACGEIYDETAPPEEGAGVWSAAAEYELILGDSSAAAGTLERVVRVALATRDVDVHIAAVRVGAHLALERGALERAATLHAACEALVGTAAIEVRTRVERERDRACGDRLRAALPQDELERAERAGRGADVGDLLRSLGSWLADAAVETASLD
jgi:predicted ATPase